MIVTQGHQKLFTLLAPLREYFQQEYETRLDRLILFGSQARGEALPTSDIDIIAQFCLEHNLLVSRLFLPQSRFETENSPLLRNIRQDGIVL
jgi:predicted nucleotidyltransferase